jgi:cardiolipin synthase
LLVTVLTVLEVVYVVVLAAWILLEKRPPVSTLAWILSLVALPYVGLVVFFLLGPRRIVRKRLKHRRARGAVRARGNVPRAATSNRIEDPRIAQLDHLAVRAGEPASDVCEQVDVFHDAASTYDAIEQAIRGAKHHVHAAYYIFDSGQVASRLRDALVAKAKEGVTVRLLVDDVGANGMTRAFVRSLRDGGVKFARFNRVTFSRIRSRFDFRNHRKIVVVDGVIGFTGGINVTDDYLASGARPAWRDTHVRFVGDAVRWLQLTFLDDWSYATAYVPRDPAYFPPPSGLGEHRVQVVGSGPDRDMEPIQKSYFAAMALARERVYVTTPYFVPDEAILTALVTAALRGVDVRVLVPRRGDSLVVTAAARSYYDTILAAGVRVYEYQPTMHHAKTLVVDDFFAAVGTANMDNRSFRLNFEVTAILYGPRHAHALAEQFRRDLVDAKEIKAHSRERLPLRWRLAEAGARVLSPLL